MDTQVQVNYGSVEASDAIEEAVRAELERACGRFENWLTRIEVHLHDDNAHKAGATDKRVVMEARPRGRTPIAVEARGDDLYTVIAEAAGKLERALAHRLERN